MQIIAGPCLKACSTSRINVWLMTDTPCKPELSVTKPGGNASLCKSRVYSQRVGQSVTAHLLVAEPLQQEFPQDQKLFYNVSVGEEDLVSLGMTTGAKTLCYDDEPLPSVVLPSVHRCVAQLSCRKPHSTASKPYPDQVVGLNKLVKDALNQQDRPTALFCTGDQIYADDVCPVLADAIKRQAGQMFDKESLPAVNGKPTDQDALKLNGRDETMYRAGFTSTHADNHLLSFAEYVLMYSAVMGGLPLSFSDYSEVRGKLAKKRKKRPNGQYVMVPSVTAKQWKKRTEVLKQFFKDAIAYRRVMANVPTYTMFDDHEVTDDWNVSKKVAQALKKAGSLGRRVHCNALAAYFFCQHWGNDGASVDATFSGEAGKYALSRENASSFEKGLLARDWSYIVPGKPAAVCLDTRTQRAIGNGRPGLLNSAAFDRLEKMLQKVAGTAETLILLSPAPVYGLDAIEKAQEVMTSGWARRLVEEFDAEYWAGNQKAFERLDGLLKNLQHRDCVILSGDVHYSFMRQGSAGSTRLWQCSSSAVHNANGKWMRNTGFKLLQKLEHRRGVTPPYLHAENRWEFMSGEPNFGTLTFDSEGVPASNRFHFYDLDARKRSVWTYEFVEAEAG